MDKWISTHTEYVHILIDIYICVLIWLEKERETLGERDKYGERERERDGGITSCD